MHQQALCIWEICRKCRDTRDDAFIFLRQPYMHWVPTAEPSQGPNRYDGDVCALHPSLSENKRVSPNLFALLFSPRLTKGNTLTPTNYFSVFVRSCCTKNPGASTADSKTGFATFTLFSRLAVAPSFLHSTPPPSYPRVSAARLLLLTS